MTYQERTSLDSDLANFVDAIKSERTTMHETWERFAPKPPRTNPLVWAAAASALAFAGAVAFTVFH